MQLQRPAWVPARVMHEGLSLEWTCGFGRIHRPIHQGCKGIPGRGVEPGDKMHRLAVFSLGVGPKVGLWCKPR